MSLYHTMPRHARQRIGIKCRVRVSALLLLFLFLFLLLLTTGGLKHAV
jgi:hypothetical protein